MLVFLLILALKNLTTIFEQIVIMRHFDESVEINHIPNWPYILDHRYRILIIGGSGSGKTIVLLNLIKH